MENITKKINNLNLVTFILCLLIISCSKKNKPKTQELQEAKSNDSSSFSFGAWITADSTKTNQYYLSAFKKYKKNGLSSILINTNTDTVLLSRLVPLAQQAGLKTHAWIMAVNRPGDIEAQKHPEWYAVNREGKSCYYSPPYVDYYKWMCPTRKPARKHILKLVAALAKVKGIESVHLDYIRYCDIFLPIGLLPKYNIKQEQELPQYDYCYCDVCINKFESIHHKNPLKMSNPALDIEWRNFRLNQIRNIVDEAYKVVHKYNKKLTAAVFPYPEMAGMMVRQRWDKWDINAVYPMLYHKFYNEEVDWIGYAARQGIDDLKGKGIEMYPGIYVPDLSPEDLKSAIDQLKDNGTNGATFFHAEAITDKQWGIISSYAK